MNKLLIPFFTRLYGAIFIAIFSSAFLTMVIIDQWNAQDGVASFVNDTTFVKKVLESQRKSNHITPEVFYQHLDTQLLPFDTVWLGKQAFENACKHCEFVDRYLGVEVYELANGELVAVHTIERPQYKLLIQDKTDEADPLAQVASNQHINLEDFAPFILLSFVVFAIGFALYLPIRQLQKDIDHLDSVSKRLAQGDFDARVTSNLSEPLTQLSQRFNQMAAALANKFNESEIFAQAVPHELRTPLSRIQLVTGILRQQELPKDQVTLIDNIDQYIEDIDELCSQVIQFSKLKRSTNEATCEQVNLSEFINYRVSQLAIEPALIVGIACPSHLLLTANTVSLRLAIDNLIKNAATHAKQRVRVTVKQENQRIRVVIEDDGTGIPESERENVFIPFSRLDKSRNRKTGGLGLGLAITMAAANLLDGEVCVDDSEMGGAKFTLTITKL